MPLFLKDPSEKPRFALSPQCSRTLEKGLSQEASDLRLMPALPPSSLTSSRELLHLAFSCACSNSNMKPTQPYRCLCGLTRAMSRNAPQRSGTFTSLPSPRDGKREWGENRWMLISPPCLQQQSVLSHAEKREAVQFVEAKLPGKM